jgi:sugar lactone lactonase YvrE
VKCGARPQWEGRLIVASFLATVLMLPGCGGSGGGTSTPPPPPSPALAMIAGSSVGAANTDGPLATARFENPFGVAIDSSGNTYVVDPAADTVRKITAAGAVSTFAGAAGQPGSADGQAGAARFLAPKGIAVDVNGNVYVSDTGNDTIREITAAGTVTTLAGTAGVVGSADGTGSSAQFNQPQGIGTDGAGNVYVADSANNLIREITPAGAVTTLAGSGVCGSTDGTGPAAQFCAPFGLAADSAGNVYVADSLNDTIREVTSAGVVSTLAGRPRIAGSSDGTGANATFSLPSGLAIDSAGTIYVADTGNATLRMVAPGGVVSTLAGTAGVLGYADGSGTAAEFRGGQGPAVDSQGNVYLADNNDLAIRKVTPQGAVSTFAGTAPELGTADGAGSGARFYGPNGLATDSAGNVYVADTLNCEIRKMTPAGAVTTLAGSPIHCTFPYFGDTDGTGAAAQFAWPYAVAVDTAGNVYVADTDNDTIRKITPAGAVTTLAGTPGYPGSADGTGSAARFNGPFGLTTDSAGNVYVADTGNDTIRKITPAGVVTTLAGIAGSAGHSDGNGQAATFFAPLAITIDGAGNLYVSDSGNSTIRQITPAGAVTTLAGTAGATGSADGAGSSARFDHPTGITTDGSDNVYVVDAGNYTVRKITPGGVVSTLVGAAGKTGFTPGGLPGVLDARIWGVAISSSTLYISTYAGIAAVTNLP